MRVDTTNFGWSEPGPSSILAEKIRTYVASGQLRFLPFVEVDAEETPEMRRNYRKMWREASIAAALDSMIFGTASLDLTVVPEDPALEADRRNAKFLEHNLLNCPGGIRGIIQSVLTPALIEGISVSEPKLEPEDRPKWPGTKLYLKEVRPIDPDDYELQEDGFRRIKSVVSRLLMKRYRPEHFIIYSYLPLFSPRGQAILRRVTREFWIIDAAMKFHRIGLERWVLPWVNAKGPSHLQTEIVKAVKSLGAQGFLYAPEEATVQAMTLAMEGDKFESAIRLYQGRISLALLGATLQANEGVLSGSRAQAQVHQGTVELGGWYRAASLGDCLNDQLAKRIVRLNFADGGIPRIKLGGVNEEERKKRLEIFMGAAQIKRLSKKQINDELGLQEPLDDNDATQIVGAAGAAPPGAGGPPPIPFADGALPTNRQSTNYTCGPTALQLALAYFDLPESDEAELASQMGTTPADGTPPEAILRVARLRGLAATERHRMSLEDLDSATEAGQVVICPIQAHGTPSEERAIQAGHYVVVYRAEDGQVSYLDPSVPGGESMNSEEFERRWIDQEADGDLYVRYGIVLAPAEQLHCGGEGGKPGPCPKGGPEGGRHEPGSLKHVETAWNDSHAKAGAARAAVGDIASNGAIRTNGLMAAYSNGKLTAGEFEGRIHKNLDQQAAGHVQQIKGTAERAMESLEDTFPGAVPNSVKNQILGVAHEAIADVKYAMANARESASELIAGKGAGDRHQGGRANLLRDKIEHIGSAVSQAGARSFEGINAIQSKLLEVMRGEAKKKGLMAQFTEDFCGGKGGKPGPCPEGKPDASTVDQPSGSHSPEAVTKAREGWLARAKEIPAKVLGAAKAKVQQKFDQLSARYGKPYAYAIMGAGLAGIPLPIPGSSILTAAPVLAVAELHKQLGGPLGFADDPAGVGHLTPQEIDELGRAFVAGLMGDEPEQKLADDGQAVAAIPVDRTKAGAAASDQTALAGPDGRAISELLAATQRRGVQVLANLTEEAVARLLKKGSPQRAQRLFTESERRELADSLASTLGPGELLGRARIRLAQAQVLQEHSTGLVTHCEDTPTSLVVFRDDENPLRPLAPEKAIEFFRSLVPTIGVDPATFVTATGQRAFTLAVATEQQILDQVQAVLLRTLETGEAGGIDAIRDLLDAAGVSHRNPFYAENVYRTNLKGAYNEGYDAERMDPDVMSTFPAWLFSGIRDGRQRKTHEIRFGLYFPASVTFAEIRDSAAGKFDGHSCRCDPIAINKFRWEKLQAQGARLETSW